MSTWSCLEDIPGLSAVKAEWQGFLGGDFERFRKAFLEEASRTARSFPCPHDCGFDHRVRRRTDGSFVGLQHRDAACKDLNLTAQDVAVWELNVERLGQAVVAALGGQGQVRASGIAGVWEIGTVPGSNVPVMLCLHERADEFCGAVAEITGRLRDRFLLVAPTNRFLTIGARDLLKNVNAEFLDLETHFTWASSGGLKAGKAALEVVARLSRPHLGTGQISVAADQIQALGKLKYRPGFNEIWFDGKLYDLSQRPKARLCIEYLVTQNATSPASARHLKSEIDPYVLQKGNYLKADDIKIQHYFKDEDGTLTALRNGLIKVVYGKGKYYLKVD